MGGPCLRKQESSAVSPTAARAGPCPWRTPPRVVCARRRCAAPASQARHGRRHLRHRTGLVAWPVKRRTRASAQTLASWLAPGPVHTTGRAARAWPGGAIQARRDARAVVRESSAMTSGPPGQALAVRPRSTDRRRRRCARPAGAGSRCRRSGGPCKRPQGIPRTRPRRPPLSAAGAFWPMRPCPAPTAPRWRARAPVQRPG